MRPGVKHLQIVCRLQSFPRRKSVKRNCAAALRSAIFGRGIRRRSERYSQPIFRASSSSSFIKRLLCENIRSGNGDKSLLAGDDHIVIAAGAVDNENVAAFIPAGDNAYMLVIGIKGKVAYLRLIPGYILTIGVRRELFLTGCS